LRLDAITAGCCLISLLVGGCVTTSELPPGCDVVVVAPASIQTASKAAGVGDTLCLSGRFVISSPIRPKDGQTFLGPAEVTGSGHTAIQARAEGAPTGAIDVTINGLEIHGFDLRAVGCWRGTTVRDSELHDNGRIGVGCGLRGGGGVLIEGNHIHSNGDPAHTGGGAGGMKFAACDGCTVRDNLIESNIGNGIWCDVDCGAFTAVGNQVEGNTRKGIFYEISHGPALIADNTVTFNNCAERYWPNPDPVCDLPDGSFGPQSAAAPGGGIAANSSLGVTIRENMLEGNEGSGIVIRDDDRPYDAPLETVIQGNELLGDEIKGCELDGVTCS
jgi:hypothetical protein